VALESRLGSDLWALVDAVGSPATEVIPVTTLPAPESYRASFRITFRDGQVLKGRCLQTEADVARLARLSPLLDPCHFPSILAHRGRALLTAWVPGRPVERHGWTPALVAACARLHATLHGRPLPPAAESLRRRPAVWEPRLEQFLDELVAHGAMAPGRARETLALMVRHAPAEASPAGLCHTDFCAENIVTTTTGHPWIVDNEGVNVDAYEFDLARTWYRWPMTSGQQQAYADGYGERAHGARFAAHFLHWALAVLVESAARRVRARAASARVPLERLATMLRTHGRGESFPRILAGG
jgi:Phosphotransferase enzyme family